MSKMTHPTQPVIALESKVARAYLLSMAETLAKSVSCEVTGEAAGQVAKCIAVMQHMAQQLTPIEDDSAAAQMDREVAVSDLIAVWHDIAALAEAETGYAAIAERIAQAPVTIRSFDFAGFETYLSTHLRGGRGTRITDSRILPGGRSKITALVQQSGATDLPADLVIRQDWAAGAVPGNSVVSEYALIRHLHAAGLLVPEPLLLERENVLGSPFMVVSRIAGHAAGTFFVPPKSERLALDLADQLARLHSLPANEFAAFGVPLGARKRDQMLAALDDWRSLQDRVGSPIRIIDIALSWMKDKYREIDETPLSLVHNDIGPHNLMMADDGLSAILDWEFACLDHPAIDLGYIRPWIGKLLPWERFMDNYRAAGGPLIPSETIDFYALWGWVRLYTLLIRARDAATKGIIRDIDVVHNIVESTQPMLLQIARDLGKVLEGDKA